MTFRSIPVSNDPAQDLCWDWWDMWLEVEAGCEDPDKRRAENIALIEAWRSFSEFAENVKTGGEWDVPEGTDTRLLDEAEMFWDMNKEVEELNCHHLFRRSVWEERGDLTKKPVNKRTETRQLCKVTQNGNDYMTASTPMGKVFIPKWAWNGEVPAELDAKKPIYATFRIRFLGFEGSRPKRTMPWRAEEMIGEWIGMDDDGAY